jgi:hypothetical protein
VSETTELDFIGFQVPQQVKIALRELAETNDRSLSAEVRHGLAAYLRLLGVEGAVKNGSRTEPSE